MNGEISLRWPIKFARNPGASCRSGGEKAGAGIGGSGRHSMQFVTAGAADWVPDGDIGVTSRPQNLGHEVGGGHKLLSHHRRRRDTPLFGLNGVVQTTRRATASIPDPGNQRIPSGGPVHDFGAGRRTVVGFGYPNDVGHTVPGAQFVR